MVDRIHLLDETTINQIAAGEVIERPASIVKELIENAIDAHATRIFIDIRDGGRKMIRVADNGIGMSRHDVELAIRKHSTCKLLKIDDLEQLATLGFRGEALPSIAAVARLEIITREATQEDLERMGLRTSEGGSLMPEKEPTAPTTPSAGVRMVVEGGEVKAFEETAALVGTTMIIEDLFYNVPVRKKYLKPAATELAHISDVVSKYALIHPEIHFQLNHGKRQIFDAPASSAILDTIANIYGRELAREMLKVSAADATIDKDDVGQLRLEGYISKPSAARRTANDLSFFVNRRHVKSQLVNKAIRDAYGTLLGRKNYPVAVLNLTVLPKLIDVNIHPTKREIRFAQELRVANFLRKSVQRVLEKHQLFPRFRSREFHVADLTSLTAPLDAQAQPPARSAIAKKEQSTVDASKSPSIGEQRSPGEMVPGYQREPWIEPGRGSGSGSGPSRSAVGLDFGRLFHTDTEESAAVPYPDTQPSGPRPVEREYLPRDAEERIGKKLLARFQPVHMMPSGLTRKRLGRSMAVAETMPRQEILPVLETTSQFHNTYILAQDSGHERLFIIDQHAAHERVLYEQFKRQYEDVKVQKQSLISPLTLELSPREVEMLNAHLPALQQLGFELDPFGGTTYLVRSVPIVLGRLENVNIIHAILDELFELEKPDPEDRESLRESVIKIMACKSAIKANDMLDAETMHTLLKQLYHLENPYTCPHGRPTMIVMPLRELEKKFKRIQ